MEGQLVADCRALHAHVQQNDDDELHIKSNQDALSLKSASVFALRQIKGNKILEGVPIFQKISSSQHYKSLSLSTRLHLRPTTEKDLEVLGKQCFEKVEEFSDVIYDTPSMDLCTNGIWLIARNGKKSMKHAKVDFEYGVVVTVTGWSDKAIAKLKNEYPNIEPSIVVDVIRFIHKQFILDCCLLPNGIWHILICVPINMEVTFEPVSQILREMDLEFTNSKLVEAFLAADKSTKEMCALPPAPHFRSLPVILMNILDKHRRANQPEALSVDFGPGTPYIIEYCVRARGVLEWLVPIISFISFFVQGEGKARIANGIR